jgi:hypothetical protein
MNATENKLALRKLQLELEILNDYLRSNPLMSTDRVQDAWRRIQEVQSQIAKIRM